MSLVRTKFSGRGSVGWGPEQVGTRSGVVDGPVKTNLCATRTGVGVGRVVGGLTYGPGRRRRGSVRVGRGRPGAAGPDHSRGSAQDTTPWTHSDFPLLLSGTHISYCCRSSPVSETLVCLDTSSGTRRCLTIILERFKTVDTLPLLFSWRECPKNTSNS